MASHEKQSEDKMMVQRQKIDELKASLGELSGRSLMYCSDACLRRYLEARNWHVGKAKKMLEESLKWRASYKPEEIRWHEVAAESETGKLFRANFHDRHGRPVILMRPAKQNSTCVDAQIRQLVYFLENAIINLPEGQEQMVWLVDYTGLSLSTKISIKSSRETTHILQNHYPERLAVAFLYNPPRIFDAFWKVCKYFIDAKTFEKVKIIYPKNKDSVELMNLYFDVDNLPTEFGGKATLQYDHEKCSLEMVQDDARTAKFWGCAQPDEPSPESSRNEPGSAQ